MRSAGVAALLVAVVSAQSSVTILNFYPDNSALTVKGSESGTTTYEKACPATSGSATPSASAASSAAASSAPAGTSVGGGDVDLTPITALPTAPARRRRQLLQDDDPDCEPYKIIQGASTYEFHLTDPVPGAWTVDMKCNWQGEFTTADITCTATNSGSAFSNQQGTSTETFKSDEVKELSAIQTVALASATTTPAASTTPSGSGASAAPSGAGASTSPSGTGVPAGQSTGLAAPGPLPTGAIAFVGGAAGLFAAALAL